MSEVVLMDGQFTMCRFLKPFPNFEQIYQGASGTRPIAFPGVLDVFAQRGARGYDPNLIAGITVPLGSRITLWIPQTLTGNATGEPPNFAVNANYQYQILWRLRTVGDYRAGQEQGQTSTVQSYSNYHLPSSPLGQPQAVTSPFNPLNNRFFLPGATRTVAFEQAEPAGGAPGVIHLRGEQLQPLMDPVWVQPLTPAGFDAVWQQGTYVGSSATNPGGPSWMTFQCDAEGDEMAILASKIDPTHVWNFTTDGATGDLSFSNTYGNNNGQNVPNPYTSILVTTGTN